ncbi:hypothetical protein VTL71DRAFT_12097 [Oculimacula yallundae]|uniref:BTB domain-containing protein n=1 Tax=Oculimacula yallundae TaxID=86028 RepID=A0ABR4CUJ8_9HELO
MASLSRRQRGRVGKRKPPLISLYVYVMLSEPTPATNFSTLTQPSPNSDPEDIVTLIAGEDLSEKPMNVHKEVACHYSPVLKAAFNRRFQEGESQTYRIEDYMYNRNLDIDSFDPIPADKNLADKMLIEIWVLADKLLIPGLQNFAIFELEDLGKRYKTTSTDCLEYVYERTPSGSPLRKFFLQQCAFNVTSKRFLERPEQFPKEMLLKLATVMNDAISQLSPAQKKGMAKHVTYFKADEGETTDEDEDESIDEGEKEDKNGDQDQN